MTHLLERFIPAVIHSTAVSWEPGKSGLISGWEVSRNRPVGCRQSAGQKSVDVPWIRPTM